MGCKSNVIYSWNQVAPIPQDPIFLPENNVVNIITVNNMGYVFAGSKGNIYLTNGNAASAAISVPDYCAGIPGIPASYIEPYFTWGGAAFIRGRIYFSILDQTASKVGNCGGIWSFIPTQIFFYGQDVGLSLRLDNQNSYGTYSGYAPVIINSQTQNGIGAQYWAAWESDITSPQYGIDFTSTGTRTPAIIETDLITTADFPDKKSFERISYKLAAPLWSGESVSISYRLNATDAYTSCGTAVVESATDIAGYFVANLEKTQLLQLKVTLNAITSTNQNVSFIRLLELRIN